MSEATISPFALMFVQRSPKLLATTSATVVINGKRITNARQVARADADDAEEAARLAELKRELQRAKDRARYQRDRLDPTKMAKRQAYYDANREKVAAYKRDYDLKNRDRIRAAQSSWAAREYRTNPEAGRIRQRRFYAEHREEILEALRLKRVAAKEARTKATP